MVGMLSLIPALPFAGFLLNASFGRRLSKAASGAIACGVMALAFLVSAAMVWRLIALPAEEHAIVERVFTWISVGRLEAAFSLYLDPLSALMILVVTGIGLLIHIYSTAYMHEESDAEYARYFSYLNLFAAFMLLLVLGSNFLVMFIGWEGVGLCSYLLIGFWFRKASASDAGKKAFIVNRIGDFAFILGILFIVLTFGSIEFQEVARAVSRFEPEVTFGTISLITLLLFIGATGKSAQIPLYVWLPDAMEGPTPVSALIHAATMVTAGVYMIGRNAALFSHAPETLAVVATIGAATALMAGTIAIVQTDIKRVLAYSTVSQLGYMFLAMGVGAYSAGIFHLFTHAFFKALLFLGSGAVIHALAGEQDLRRMGGLKSELPLTYWTFVIGALAIAGVPGLAGFFSKDEILFRTFASGHVWLWAIGSVTALLTAIYMFRLVFMAFHGARAGHKTAGPKGPALRQEDDSHAVPHHLHDAPPAMALALVVLAAGSLVAGYWGLPHALGGANWFEHFLAPSLESGVRLQPDLIESDASHANETLELALMAFSTALAISGIALAGFLYLGRRDAPARLAARFPGVHKLLLNKYYVDEVYDQAIVQPVRILSEDGLWRTIDAGVIDGAVNGAGGGVSGFAAVLRRVQTGSIRTYAASLVLGAALILGYWLSR